MILSTDKRVRERSIVQNFLLMVLPLVLILGTMAGCEGPAGSEGAQGPQGEQGAVGPAGEDGSVMHAGKGDPQEDMGTSGDYYLNRNTGELYGPKNDKGWGTPISLQGLSGQDGKDGQDGEDGSQIHSGTGAPSASVGVKGDYYLDKANFDLYGPKSGKGWGIPVNLKGPANVMYSSWTTLSAIRDTTFDGSNLKVGDIDAPQLSQEIMDQGVVNVYMNFFGSVMPLPYTSNAGGKTNVINYMQQLDKLHVTRFSLDNSASVSFSSYLEFRYVIIPGGVAAKSKLSRQQLKEMSYQEIRQRFGIRD